MAKLSKNDLKRALRAAQAERVTDQPRKPMSSERAMTALVADWMKTSGFDHKALAALKEHHRVEADREVERQRAEDARTRRPDAAHAAVASQAQMIQAFASKGGFFPLPTITLSQPRLILAEPNSGIIKDSRIVPFDSSAKIRVDTKRSGVDKLSFIYQWQHEGFFPVIIDAVTFLSASGRVHIRQAGGFGWSLGTMEVKAKVEALALTQPPAALKHQEHELCRAAALGYPFWIDGTDDASFSEGLQLSVSQCVVPPQTAVIFEVSVAVECDFDPGRAVADLESGSFGIHCPLVVVSIRGQQPPVIVE